MGGGAICTGGGATCTGEGELTAAPGVFSLAKNSSGDKFEDREFAVGAITGFLFCFGIIVFKPLVYKLRSASRRNSKKPLR
jgi:hypothetical protein